MVRIRLHEDGLNGHMAGDIVDVSEAESKFWLSRDRGEVVDPEPEPIIETEPEPVIETAEAAPPPENAAKRTTKSKPRTRKTT